MDKRDAKKDFIDAFWKIYKTRKIEKISIRELCQVAGYNRTTFYVYFESIYDLLDQAIENLTSPVTNAFKKVTDLNNILKNNTIEAIFLSIFVVNDKYIGLIIKQNHHYILEEKIKTTIISLLKAKLKTESLNTSYIDYIIEYQVSAVFGIIKHWFQDRDSMNENELFKLIYKISSNGVLTLISNEFLSIEHEK